MCLQVEVSPIENAVYVVENKTQELRTLISQYQHRQHQGNINPLSMCLNGVIDAAVNGGIARYQEVEPEKARLYPPGLRRSPPSCFRRPSSIKTTSAVTQKTRRGSRT